MKRDRYHTKMDTYAACVYDIVRILYIRLYNNTTEYLGRYFPDKKKIMVVKPSRQFAEPRCATAT